MALKIRLTRMGTRSKPFYRVVVADSRARRDGKYIENLGTYDPKKDPMEFDINRDRALYWLGHGAKLSDTVHSLMKRFHLMPSSASAAGSQPEKPLVDTPSEGR